MILADRAGLKFGVALSVERAFPEGRARNRGSLPDGEPSAPSDCHVSGGETMKPPMAAVTGKVICSRPIMVDAFAYLQSLTGISPRPIAKMTIPSPSMLYMRGGRKAVSSAVYTDLTHFWDDVAGAYRRAIRYFAERGCTYLQLDDVSFAYLCDPKFRDGCR